MWAASAVLALVVPAVAERLHTDVAASFLQTPQLQPAVGDECSFGDHHFEGEADAVDVLPTTVDDDKKQDPNALQPYKKVEVSMAYEEVGCFDLEEHDEGNSGGKAPLRDLYCRDFMPEGTTKCRSGLPFYRRALEREGGAEFRKCMEYCLGSGLDIFGIVEQGKGGAEMDTVECRCGASKENLQAWTELVHKDHLIAELYGIYPKKADCEECPVWIGRYDPEWMERYGNGGTPVTLLRMTVLSHQYMHQIFHGSRAFAGEDGRLGEGLEADATDFGEDSSAEPSLVEELALSHEALSSRSNRTRVFQRKPMYKRDCAREQCAAGEAWGNRIYVAFTQDVDTTRYDSYMIALQRIADHIPCIEFVIMTCKDALGQKRVGGYCRESDLESADGSRIGIQTPAEGVILVGNRDPHNPMSGCYTAGLGFPGMYGMRFINLGWCNSHQHIGNMMHETGHALGMHHEHNRADATASYLGQGPFLEIFKDEIIRRATEQAKMQDPNIRGQALSQKIQTALYQYQMDETTYMGSTARGGRSIFDYGSIMMYPASHSMRSNRRRISQAQLPGCHDQDCLDSLMGQRQDFSEEDTLQLRDMFGCLPTPKTRCPAIYGSELVDEGGDCQCPSETICYYEGNKGCPFGGQTTRYSINYFSHSCESCRCVAPSCPAEAGSIKVSGSDKVAPPDKEGDCKCPEATVCRLGSRQCPSSRSNNDPKFFSPTCDGCVCQPVCSAESNAVNSVANDDGNCLCPLDTQCFVGKATKPGCKKSSGAISVREFKATCRACVCDAVAPPPATCLRSKGEDAVSESPDGMGDCLCARRTVCININTKKRCTYSGGTSLQYFSAECLDCQCILPTEPKLREQAQKPLFLMHHMCDSGYRNGYIPTKCGATQAQSDRYIWPLGILRLKDSECGRCVRALQASQDFGQCERSADGLVLGANYRLVVSGSKQDLCCKKYTCDQDREASNRLDPCDGYTCGKNAECGVEEDLNGVKTAQCFCFHGFDPAENGQDCVPEVPDGSRCCRYRDQVMWVPRQYLERSRSIECTATDKYTCPVIAGKRWRRGRVRLCNLDVFVYQGDSKTPLDQ